MENFNKNIEEIRTIMKDLKADMYAVQNPELVSLDEYVKGLYLKVLCSVIQYENDPSEMQILFLERILKGIEVDDTAEDFMRKALEITDENIREFLSILGENKIRYYFALDGLLLVSMGKGNENNYKYLAELIELLGVNKDDLEYISTIAKSVLRQESRLYDEAKNLVNERIGKLNFSPYIQIYYAGAIVDTNVEKYYSAPDKKKSNIISCPISYEERFVTFENISISVSEDWNFKGCEKVVFKNCDFISDGGNFIFSSIGQVVFDGCKASGFTNRVSIFRNINKLQVINSEFLNCGYTCVGDRRGGVFLVSNEYASPIKEVILNGNKLLNCYIKAEIHRYNYGVSGVFMGFDECRSIVNGFELKNNIFNGCSCINNGNYTSAIIGKCEGQIDEENNKCTGELTRVLEM